ncbi:hypothetical protein [Halocynthiibacter namhaensis]|uniref:hypothetical protein n=1 Tax=Halocynthiibacter namhaensis TaxID=1290553 RepID=UPI00057958F6|nr:hypothetical protein [Halocynthiibacter namhaensis]
MTPEALKLIETFLPAGIAILTILGGGIMYQLQKSADRKNQILQERRELYRKFIGRAQQLEIHRLTKNEAAAISEYPDFKVLLSELMVTAPDEVVETLRELDKCVAALLAKTFQANPKGAHFGDSTDEATLLNNMSKAFETAVVAMRRDSFKNTNFTVLLVGDLLKISTGIVKR